MSRFIESICIKNGEIQNILYHQKRIDRVLNAYFGNKSSIDLSERVNHEILPKTGIWKCRVIYSKNIISLGISRYKIKKPKSLKVIHCDNIDYTFKFENRNQLNALFKQKKEADDIIIVKNGRLTDSYYCNLAFLKDGRWFTPSSPLLKGTMRSYLLANGKIIEYDILLKDINQFTEIMIFNAMIPFNTIVLPLNKILF